MSERAPAVLVDAGERERIRTSLDESLVVEAAAGTGKTSELVRRLINVLAAGRGRVQSIVAVTFTEKAAGELKLRLRAGLEEERSREVPQSPRHRALETAIAELEEARISTIHGFCKELLQERPVEARVDPGFEILDDAEARALHGQAFDRWLEQALEDPPEGVRRALRRGGRRRSEESPAERLRQAAWTLAEWRDLRTSWRRPALDREAAVDRLVARAADLAARLEACSNRGDSLYRKTWRLRRLCADLAVSERLQPRDHDGLEAALVELAEDRDFREPGRGSPRAFGGPDALEQILALHGQLIADIDEFARLINADLAALLHGEMAATIDGYEALKARAGRLDFFDLLLRTRDLLRDRADVRAMLHARFSHIFVDEFQDTDPLQAEILMLLAASDPAVSRWQEATPAPGKLFLVGDPKQSIYRFRRADVGMYQEIKNLLIRRGVACLHLTTSFRSVPAIQALVNTAFAPVMTEDGATLQAGYVPLARHREPLPGQPAVVALPVPRPVGAGGLGPTKTAINASLPDAAAAFVRWLLDASGFRVSEREHPGEVVGVRPRHVCLLFRRFSSYDEDVTRPFVEALEARDVPHLLVGGKSFHLREEVESVRAALAAIEWPDDELAVYATLKGPLLAIGDEELLEWRARFRRLHPFRPPGEGEKVDERLRPVAEALGLLRELHRRRNARPVEETVRALLRATRAHAGLVLRPWGEQALANVTRIAELARRYEMAGGLSFRGFVDRLREEADDEAPEAPLVEEGSEGVRLMTVHRAKGLEFPVVILADVTANITSRRPSRHVDAGRGLAAVGLGRWLPLDLLEHEADELARERAEGVRVAYVAATRARDLLVVPALGDDPFASAWEYAHEGWVAPVQRALYPAAAHRRSSAPAPGCPDFGEDSVLGREDTGGPGRDNVRPGWHRLEGAGEAYDVVWWDPARLTLDVKPQLGLRRRELLEESGGAAVGDDRDRYEAWRAEREATLARGARPSLLVEPATAWARRERAPGAAAPLGPPASAPGREGAAGAAPARSTGADLEVAVAGVDVAIVELTAARPAATRPAGPRFGALVHAALAVVPLDGDRPAVEQAVALQARVLGATAAEAEAAAPVVAAVLAHPLLARARAAERAGRCRRETPVDGVDAAGVLVEGVLDLAFEDDDGWTVVDFKTSADPGGPPDRDRRQVALYAAIVQRATGRPARAVLMRV